MSVTTLTVHLSEAMPAAITVDAHHVEIGGEVTIVCRNADTASALASALREAGKAAPSPFSWPATHLRHALKGLAARAAWWAGEAHKADHDGSPDDLAGAQALLARMRVEMTAKFVDATHAIGNAGMTRPVDARQEFADAIGDTWGDSYGAEWGHALQDAEHAETPHGRAETAADAAHDARDRQVA